LRLPVFVLSERRRFPSASFLASNIHIDPRIAAWRDRGTGPIAMQSKSEVKLWNVIDQHCLSRTQKVTLQGSLANNKRRWMQSTIRRRR
jgi:hypothetical protein